MQDAEPLIRGACIADGLLRGLSSEEIVCWLALFMDMPKLTQKVDWSKIDTPERGHALNTIICKSHEIAQLLGVELSFERLLRTHVLVSIQSWRRVPKDD
jgi:hypothetical protein